MKRASVTVVSSGRPQTSPEAIHRHQLLPDDRAAGMDEDGRVELGDELPERVGKLVEVAPPSLVGIARPTSPSSEIARRGLLDDGRRRARA